MDRQRKDLFRYRYRWKWWDQRDATKSVSRMHCVAEVICTFVTLIWRTVAHFAKVSFKLHCRDVWLLKVLFFVFDVSDFGMQPPPFRFRKSCHGKKEMITPFTAISVLTSKIALYSLQNDGFFAASKTCECFNCPTEPAERVNGIGGPSPPCCKQQGWQGIKANSIKVEYICWNGFAWSSKVLSSVESSFLRSSSMTHLRQPTSKWRMMPIVPVASVPSETWDTRVQGSCSWTIQKPSNWVSWVPSQAIWPYAFNLFDPIGPGRSRGLLAWEYNTVFILASCLQYLMMYMIRSVRLMFGHSPRVFNSIPLVDLYLCLCSRQMHIHGCVAVLKIVYLHSHFIMISPFDHSPAVTRSQTQIQVSFRMALWWSFSCTAWSLSSESWCRCVQAHSYHIQQASKT